MYIDIKFGVGPDIWHCRIVRHIRQGMPENPAGYPASGKKNQIRPNPTDYPGQQAHWATHLAAGSAAVARVLLLRRLGHLQLWPDEGQPHLQADWLGLRPWKGKDSLEPDVQINLIFDKFQQTLLQSHLKGVQKTLYLTSFHQLYCNVTSRMSKKNLIFDKFQPTWPTWYKVRCPNSKNRDIWESDSWNHNIIY